MIESRAPLMPDGVAALAAAAGIAIDPERLPDVVTVLNELFTLESEIAGLDLTGFEPDLELESWLERGS